MPRTSRRLMHLTPQSTEEDILTLNEKLNIATPRKTRSTRSTTTPSRRRVQADEGGEEEKGGGNTTEEEGDAKNARNTPSPKRNRKHSDYGPKSSKKRVTPEKKDNANATANADANATATRTLRNKKSVQLVQSDTRAALVRESTFGEKNDTGTDAGNEASKTASTSNSTSGVFKTPSKTPRKTPSRRNLNSLKKEDTFDEYVQPPKTLFKELTEGAGAETEASTHTPTLLREESFSAHVSNIYATARNAIRSMNASCDGDGLVGREAEVDTIREFVDHASPHSSLYVSGPPGGGKTAAVRLVTRGMRATWLNCMAYSGDGVGGLIDEMSSSKSMLIILDEIDTLPYEHLIQLFRLAQEHTHLKLIGIANALDLTSNQLQNLAHPPLHLQVHPYTVDQLNQIVGERLGAYRQLFMPQALELLSRKVAALTGDLRQVISVLTLCLDSVEKEQKRVRGKISELTLDTATKVTMSTMLKSISMRVKSAKHTQNHKIQSLNLYSRIALLCVMLTMKRKTKLKSSVSLYDNYVYLLNTHSTLTPTTKSDFIDLVNVLVSASILIEHVSAFDQNSAKDAMLGTPSKRARTKAAMMASEPEFALQYSEPELVRLLGVAREQSDGDDPQLEQLKRVYWGECRRIDAEAVRQEWKSRRTPLGEGTNPPVDVFV